MNTAKKILCLLLAGILMLSACAPQETVKETKPGTTAAGDPTAAPTAKPTEKPADPTPPEATEPPKTEFKDGVIGEGPKSGRKEGVYSDGMEAPMPEVEEWAAAGTGIYDSGIANPYLPDEPYLPEGPEPRAGLLTAREWSDFKNAEDFLEYVTGQESDALLKERSIRADSILRVEGLPALGKLVLKNENGAVIAQAAANIEGKAVIFFERMGDTVRLSAGGEEREIALAGRITDVDFGQAPSGQKAAQLDLMLMVDTTGSMGDELEYLKKELANVVESVYRLNPDLSIRVSVNFYRDEGDEYVVKYYDFRDDVQAAVALIEEQYSEGGGDYPEAVHTALDNAIFGHDWREDAVKLCYLVFDAPPHKDGSYVDVDEQTRRRVENIDATLQNAVNGAVEAGIRIIPVAASGADSEVETLGRYWAFATGGTYIYLTNDSGIGYYHETPDVPETKLEYLNDCMIRVTAEYCGLVYEGQ